MNAIGWISRYLLSGIIEVSDLVAADIIKYAVTK
jgi:hypothetical protein